VEPEHSRSAAHGRAPNRTRAPRSTVEHKSRHVTPRSMSTGRCNAHALKSDPPTGQGSSGPIARAPMGEQSAPSAENAARPSKSGRRKTPNRPHSARATDSANNLSRAFPERLCASAAAPTARRSEATNAVKQRRAQHDAPPARVPQPPVHLIRPPSWCCTLRQSTTSHQARKMQRNPPSGAEEEHLEEEHLENKNREQGCTRR